MNSTTKKYSKTRSSKTTGGRRASYNSAQTAQRRLSGSGKERVTPDQRMVESGSNRAAHLTGLRDPSKRFGHNATLLRGEEYELVPLISRLLSSAVALANQASVRSESQLALWRRTNQAYQGLVDKSFAHPLSARDQSLLDRLGRALDRMIEPYDLRRIDAIAKMQEHG